jgi:hypothetical protein
MKKVLLTSTAVALTAGMVSAGDMSMSGSLSLTYGSWGTGSVAGAAVEDFSPEADLNVAMTSTGGAISMTGSLEIDETGDPTAGPITISSGALTLTYDNDDMGALSLTDTTDGEGSSYGDYSIAFSAGGIGVTYTKDQESSDNAIAVSYSTGALSLSMTSIDETTGDGAGTLTEAAAAETVIGATYVTGPYTISLSGNDAAAQEWDASVAMVSGDTTVTVAADEAEVMSVGIAYTAGNVTMGARQEFNGDDETEFNVSYTEGALTFGAAYDSGQGGTVAAGTAHFGSEAQLVLNASYTDGDVTVAAQGNDQDEMEVSISFAF